MVVFTCNNCGDSLKKNQVEKHFLGRCRFSELVSCLDCGKDFYGNDYQNHTKCISEQEKYSGKDYKPKPGTNKGEAKQEQWIQQVQSAIDKGKPTPKLANLLSRMKEYPNIPRKKVKFEKFLYNSLGVRGQDLAGQAWNLLMENQPPKVDEPTKTPENVIVSIPQTEVADIEDVKKLSKRDRKEERRKATHKKEKKDRNVPEISENGASADSVAENGVTEHVAKSKKKRKRQDVCDEEVVAKKTKGEDDEGAVSEEGDGGSPAKKKQKFNWEAVIAAVVQSKEEITLKRLRKKVLAEYLSHGGSEKSEGKLWSKFEKKVTKNPKFIVHKDRVKLAQH